MFSFFNKNNSSYKWINLSKTRLFFAHKLSKSLKMIENDEKRIEFLKKINIFKNIELQKNKISVIELNRVFSIQSKIGSDNQPNIMLDFKLPNLFGSGESFDLLVSKTGSEFILKKPLIFGPKVNFIEISSFKEKFLLVKKNYKIKGIKFLYSADNYKIGISNHKISSKTIKKIFFEHKNLIFNAGIFKSRNNNLFLKTVMNFDKKFKYNLLFLENYISLGFINGLVHRTERFFLGSNVKGYKNQSIIPVCTKNGGNSFLENYLKLGISILNANIFIFKSFGFNSVQNNILNCIHTSLCTVLFNRNKENLGLGLGIGFNYSFSKKFVLESTFTLPLNSNKNTEKLQFNFNLIS